VSGACKHGIEAPRECLVCSEDSPSTPEQRLAAEEWKRDHFRKFIAALNACHDIQTLRALAHRLGYKEGI
jgi:hypothetical protein